MKLSLSILFIVACFFIQAQTQKLDTVFCDCKVAKTIAIKTIAKVNKTIPPPHFGAIQEISTDKQNSKYTFEKEHASAWYKLNIQADGQLNFKIYPNNKHNDYDFMLFKANGSNLCDSLTKYHVKPIRACISRVDTTINGITGISTSAEKEFIKLGKGDAYVKAVDVKKNETYYLVLDNVSEKGEGHAIQFYITNKVKFEGEVLNENNKAIQAEITVTNPIGDTVALLRSNAKGKYEFEAALVENSNYTVNFYNDSSFVYSKTISTTDKKSLKSLSVVLPHLKKGLKYSIGTINFIGNSTQYLPIAIPSMNNLARLMRKNPTLKIKLIGHSNGCGAQLGSCTEFTRQRANSVKKFLVDKGILAERIEIEGKGDSEMLYPLNRATQEEQQANRRVELFVLEY